MGAAVDLPTKKGIVRTRRNASSRWKLSKTEGRRQGVGRGVNPATRIGFHEHHISRVAPLNEGRGVNPGDPYRSKARPVRRNDRSTKAGA